MDTQPTSNSPLKRYITPHVLSDLQKKIVLLGGPRQVGKTTLSKSLHTNTLYLNYDIVSDRKSIQSCSWPKSVDLVVLDELHKLHKWKTYLKGVYDNQGVQPRILVTGSGRLDIAKRMGDSLAGRHLYWKLHPLCPKELRATIAPAQALERILNQSGFPEPFYADPTFYPRWAKSHIDIILRQDLIDLEHVSDILAVETLLEIISQRVGQVVSYESLAEDLGRSPITIKRWVSLLENLFVLFRVTPWSKNIARSLLKAPKFYFFDTARVQGDAGTRFENAVACALLKEVDFQNDRLGAKLRLHYLRDRMGHELDFAVTDERTIKLALEAKWADDDFAPGFKAFSSPLKDFGAQAVQLVAKLGKERESPQGTKMVKAAEWLSYMDLTPYCQRQSIRL